MADPSAAASPGSADFVPGAPLAAQPGVGLLEEPVFARVMGQGPPMVLIHGLAVSGEMYAPVADQLAGDHLLILDLRGQAERARPSGQSPARRRAGYLRSGVMSLVSASSRTMSGI